MTDPAALTKPRRDARQSEARRLRVVRRVQEGATYDQIAEAEGLTRRRVRQIVVQTLAQRVVEPSADHARLQIARLDPALRLAAEKVAEGDLCAIGLLLRALDRLDKYQAAAEALQLEADDPNNDVNKFDAKMWDLWRRGRAREERAAAQAGEQPAESARAADDSVSKFFRA